MSKQDRQGVRTAADIEQKYNFGKSFAEVFGLASEANATANQAKDSAIEANNRLKDAETSMIRTNETITAIAKSVEEVESSVEGATDEIATLRQEVSAKMTSEEVEILVKSEVEKGTTNVKTTTGFTFDEDGLSVSKSDSEMKTQITEDGMTVYQNEDAVLTANNKGVDAKNLHATTYLSVGDRSRFENYGTDRTGCFWIGG